MTTFDAGSSDRLIDLEARVADLEIFRLAAETSLRRVGLWRDPMPIAPPPVVIEREVAAPVPPPISRPIAPPTAPPTERSMLVDTPAVAATRVEAARRIVQPKAPKPLDAFSIERLIGGRWLAAAGALIVVIGVALFLKLAYDLGWFGGLGPAARCMIAGGFGIALLGAGEIMRRRINAFAAVGMFAAGLGTCYATTLAAYMTFGLVGPTGAMALLVACVAIGVAIGASTNLAAVAALALIGGYMAPLFLWDAPASTWFMPAYLLMLLAVALVLSAWKSLRFPWFSLLRTLAWWGTLLFGVIWTMSTGASEWTIALPFLALVWGATHAERFFSARRADAAATPSSDRVTFSDARLMAGSLSTTAWCALLAIIVLEETKIAPTWWVTAALGAVTLALAIRIAGRARGVLEPPKTMVGRLGAGMTIQSGALVIATIALAFSGWIQIAAGLALGVAAVAAGRWVRSIALDLYGMAVLAFASVSLAANLDEYRTLERVVEVGWIVLRGDEWSWRIALTAGAWMLCAFMMLIRNTHRVPVHAIVSACAGVIGFMLVFVGPGAEIASLAVYWGALAAGLMIAAPVARRLGLVWIGRAVLVVTIGATMRTMWESALTPGRATTWGLVWSGWSIPWLTVAACAFISAWRAMSEKHEGARPLAVVSTFTGMIALVLMPAHPDSAAASLSVYWGLLALAAAMTPIAWRSLMLREASAVLLMQAIVAWLVAHPFTTWNESTAMLGLHEGLLLALGLACAAQLSARRLAAVLNAGAIAIRVGWVVSGLLVFVSTSLEVARASASLAGDGAAQRAAVSIYWGVFSIGLLLAGYLRRSAPTRYVGLALINIAAAKVVFVDLVGVPPAWRIASFIGLGLLMIGTAAGYARLAGRGAAAPSEGSAQ